jgi:hypothetical protein
VSETTTIKKEMGLSHKEFFRTIASALETDDFERSVSGVVLEDGGRRLEIVLGPQTERRIALLAIPSTLVTLSFSGYAKDEIDYAITMFDRAFKRGGG